MLLPTNDWSLYNETQFILMDNFLASAMALKIRQMFACEMLPFKNHLAFGHEVWT